MQSKIHDSLFIENSQRLGFGKCKLCLQAPAAWKVKGPEELAGKRIVTSFPNLAKKYFEKFDDPSNPTRKIDYYRLRLIVVSMHFTHH